MCSSDLPADVIVLPVEAALNVTVPVPAVNVPPEFVQLPATETLLLDVESAPAAMVRSPCTVTAPANVNVSEALLILRLLYVAGVI